MCKENCMKYFSKTCYRCEFELMMYTSPGSKCSRSADFHCERKEQMFQELGECREKCKPDCIKYKYPYTIEEYTLVKDSIEDMSSDHFHEYLKYPVGRGAVQLRRGLHGLLAGPVCVGPGGRPGRVAAQRHPLHEDTPSKAELEGRIFVADGSS
ncbi:hypothetical protein CDAR_50301 [Caerostris darwini]|uniref:Uncharacterized protein n=1 Tax=Caerostris darwini TaxID=1538125 RepID=A0AAV4UY70_9ARAC|nr:hypothetical protein CDAR_50301 [Caerostris darwini]